MEAPADIAPYAPVRRLGVGALGEAWLARDAHDRPVMLKRMHRHCAHDAALVEMFQHEARLLARFEHPGIPRLVAVGRDDVGLALVQEFREGDSVEALMARRAPSRAAAVEVIRQLLDVLAYVHARRDDDGADLAVVHRDVAPGNVLVSPDGDVSLVDFGIATSRWRHDPRRGQLQGTRGYMAPEVVTGAVPVDARADLFAVGVMLYELTTGRRMFQGPPAQVLVDIVEGACPDVRREVPGYPAALEAVLHRALCRDVTGRYARADEMATALLRACDEAGVTPSRREAGAWARG